MEINENNTIEFESEISKKAYFDGMTLYILKIDYVDTKDQKVKNPPPIAFRWFRKKNQEFAYNTISDLELKRITSKIERLGYKF